VANFSLNKQTANVNDTIELIDLSSTKYVEVNYGDDSGIKKVSRNIIDKHVYLTKGIFEINVKAYEHVEGLHPHKAKFKIATKSVIIN
jgi:PKD repeat protein